MTKIKRKQLLLNITEAPDGGYGVPGGNVPDVQEGDQLEDALDKIIEVLDRLAPQPPPSLDQLTLSITESVTGPVSANQLDGNPASDIYRAINGQNFLFTTIGNPELISDRDGHFWYDATAEARLRFRHFNVDSGSTKIAEMDYFDQLPPPPQDDIGLIVDTTDDFRIDTKIAELRDYYQSDPTRATFYDSIKVESNAFVDTTFNGPDQNLRQVFLEYSSKGDYSDTVSVDGGPYEYRLEEDDTSIIQGTPAWNAATLPGQIGKLSGVPSLEIGEQIQISGTVLRGIRYYYPTTIAQSAVTATDNITNSLSGTQSYGAPYNVTNNTHTFKADSYSESISGSITPYDVFSSGTPVSANVRNDYRIDSVSIARAVLDGANRYISPETKPGDTTPWDAGFNAGSAARYEYGNGNAHDQTLDTSLAPYRYALQLVEGRYEYPRSVNYSNYIHNGVTPGPNYTNVSGNFPADDWRYVDIKVGTISNKTAVVLAFDGANWSAKQPTGLHILLRVEGSSPTGGDGWLDCWSAYAGSGNPTGSSDIVGSGPATKRDAYDYNSVLSTSNGQSRRITFGASPKTGDVYVRIGVRNNASSRWWYESIRLEQA